MKSIIFTAIAIALIFVACNSNSEKTKVEPATETTSKQPETIDTVTKPATTQPVTEQLYACSMHPEVIGKKDDKCSKCGMKLTVPVKK
ncbi:hypothetical protein CAP36_11755 [Chitinophagaceae bacterium IBVUCB2]|nr:hypothetical protein CAP36_11755 [Chitinophagaceae bacterium IBVUCB2]